MNKTILERADALYFQGKPTGLSDRDYDRLSEQSGHLCKPAKNAWANYPNYQLLHPNYGLKKIPYEVAKNAVVYYPKYDGIFLQFFKDENGFHAVTRGNGRVGKDLKRLFFTDDFEIIFEIQKSKVANCEMCYDIYHGGREGLCRDIAKFNLYQIQSKMYIYGHEDYPLHGEIPQEIPSEMWTIPTDGWVCVLDDGQKYKYKGEV